MLYLPLLVILAINRQSNNILLWLMNLNHYLTVLSKEDTYVGNVLRLVNLSKADWQLMMGKDSL
jgi:hypothetical protein